MSAFLRLHRRYDAIGFLPIALSGLVVVLAAFVPHFVALQNLVNVLRSSSFLVIVASGQMLVLIVGGFDLSIGAVIALASVTSALVMVGLKHHLTGDPVLVEMLGVAAGLLSGLVVGLVNGLCVAFLRVSPFMITLGTTSAATGVALLLTNGIPVYGLPPDYVSGFGRGVWFGLPSATYLAAATVAAVWVMQRFTRMGRYLRALGGNLQAALVSGIRVEAYLVAAYASCSVLAAVAGLAITAQIGSGQAVMSATVTLESIAAAVIAGVSLKGGVGRVEMVALGAIFLLTLTNAMDLLKIDTKVQTVFLGIVIVLAAVLDEWGRRRRADV